ncbi:MAG TPA: hypothetical protein VNZ52_11460, partial [Candidatus Thermoplasmatota archaeon]|nr:hypothetical protein [Candidatus Thermoplasmatota archaeon]
PPGGAGGKPEAPGTAGRDGDHGKPDEAPGKGKDPDKAPGKPEDTPGRGPGKDDENRSRNDTRGRGRDENFTPPGKETEPPGTAISANTHGATVADTTPAGTRSQRDERIEAHAASGSTASVAAAPQAPRVFVEQAGQTVAVAQGEVQVATEHVEDRRASYIVLVHPDGREEVLVENSTRGGWNTTSYENGYYTLEVRERREDGSVHTLASSTILVTNPRATMVMAVAAVATGAAASAAAGALAARGVDVLSLLRQSVTELTGDIAEERVRSKTASLGLLGGARRSWWQRIPGSGLVARAYANRRYTLGWIAFAGLLLAVFKAYSDNGSFEEFLEVLPIAGSAVLLFVVSDYSAEWALARATGAAARFRFWAPGTLSLIVSSVVFRSAFGYPGYMQEEDAPPDRHHDAAAAARLAGVRALAFLGAGLGLTLPFILLGAWWRWDFAEYGIGVALMTTAAAAMPFLPMPGKDIWSWSKGAWCGIFGLTVTYYLLWQLAVLPLLLLEVTAVVGIAFFLLTLGALRRGKV